MTGKTCLDSSVVIRHFRGESLVTEKIKALGTPCLASFAYGELIYGARLARNPEESRSKLDALVARCVVLHPDAATLETYANLKVQLRTQGTPIPENDIWIAALCLQHDMELAFRDKHFEFVPGLKKLHWKQAAKT